MKDLSRIIGSIGLFITLAFSGSFLDTYNYIKFLVLLFGTVYVFAFWVAQKDYKNLWRPFNKIPLSLFLLFLFLNIISAIINGANYEILFGSFGRQMGLISISCLIIISIITLTTKSSSTLIRFITISLTISNVYGMFQFFGFDFYKFEKLYDGINSTFGNPNFAGGAASVSAILYLHYYFESKDKNSKAVFSLLLLISVINIYGSLARQAYLSLIIGFLIYGFRWVYKKPRIVTYGYFTLLFFGTVGALLGMLQIGPLTSFVYKSSISERGDFYRTALNTIKENPFIGVGPDQFGMFYRIYRDLNQVSRTGINTTSDSAHNAILQSGATTGIFAMVILSLIYFWVFKTRAKRFYFNSTETAIFSVWIVISLQNMISVDHPSMSFWWWVFTALLIGARDFEELPNKKKVNSKIDERVFLSHGIAFISLIAAIVINLPQIRSQTLLLQGFTTQINLEDRKSIELKRSLFESSFKSSPKNFEIFRFGANSFFQDGDFESAATLSEKALSLESSDYPSAWFLAESLTRMNNRNSAIEAWRHTIKLDPLNFRNHFELGRLLVETDALEAKRELVKCLELFPDNQTRAEANNLLNATY